MPVLEPPPATGQQNEPEDLTFALVREQVRLQGYSDAVRSLRDDTRSRLDQIKAYWPSEWTYI